MKTILFYWSKGADIRRSIISEVSACEKKKRGCYINVLAGKFKLSHVAVKKHVDLLLEEGYLKVLNPNGKPVFLALTKKGNEVLEEFSKH